MKTNKSNPYCDILEASLPRLLSALNTEPASRVIGSADRLYWAWGAKDFPNADFQRGAWPLAVAVELGLLSRDDTAPLVEKMLAFWTRIQHRDGTFDQWFPEEHSVGTAAFTLADVCATLKLFPEFKPLLRTSALQAARAVSQLGETHGYISNHRAGMALALLRTAEIYGEDGYRDFAHRLLEEILRHQSQEGWFLEYTGADPGYETLALSYLSGCVEIEEIREVREAAERSLEFLAALQHSDGTLGGDYGARGTEIVFPAGIEWFWRRGDLSSAGTLASGIRTALTERKLITPLDCDDSNFFALLSNYAAAALVTAQNPESHRKVIPSDSSGGDSSFRHFSDAGLVVIRSESGLTTISTRKNGLLRSECGEEVFHDAGYLASTGGVAAASCLEDPANETKIAESTIVIEGGFHVVPLETPTPVHHILLRFLFFT
ncbi:MAG: hypothetical protein D6679_05615, partial [Candidatus Hydrogenedentota bacterium]